MDNAGLVMGGFGALDAGMRENEERQRQEAAQNRPLSPAVEKWLRLAMNGEMSPDEAAIRAKLEAEAGGGQQPQAPVQQPMQQGQMAMPMQGLSAAAPQVEAQAGLTQPAPAAPVPQRIQQTQTAQQPRGLTAPAVDPTQARLTQRDATQIQGLMPLFNQANRPQPMSFAERKALMEATQAHFNKRNERTVGSREEEGDQNRSLRDQISQREAQVKLTGFKNQFDIAMLKANEAMRRSMHNSGTQRDIAAMRIQASRESANLRALAQTMMSDAYFLQDPTARGHAQKMQEALLRMADGLDKAVVPAMGEGPGPVSTGQSGSVSSSGPGAKPPSPQDLNALFGK